jgi:hypothetical protein
MRMSEGLRQHARFAVRWPIVYANDELFGKGTILNVSYFGGQAVGTMPVAVGMVFKMWVFPAQREGPLYVKEARVLWARAHEFGLGLSHVHPQDHQWLISFLENAERRTSFRRTLQPPSQEELAAMPLALPLKD